ncbi:MAG: indole-3-glycerol phosphate synthase TrpC [Candidatus Hadarchaeum sp.]|uniref:indole-3-glycerol phosphate synthase TrpC n=1 Tax=Candidatus Hadarchaeum sp. TaxID=2883567 RepID=UPI003179585E
MNFLTNIVQEVRKEVQRRARVNQILCSKIPKVKRLSLIGAIEEAERVPIIAEIKRASPSVGDIRLEANVIEVAYAMVRGGAVSLSVITESKYFKGDPIFLGELRNKVDVPLIYKNFIVDEYQILEAARLGADVVLLIVKLLGPRLRDFMLLAEELGMESLVEVTNKREIKLAVLAGAQLIGINNRDLETLKVNLQRTVDLAPDIPEDVTLVSESGIFTAADVRSMLDAGADAVLVGTALMTSRNIEQKVRSLVNAR